MIAAVADHLWQSTAFAALAGLLALALHSNRAAVRYWLWFAASLKFLIPFSLLVTLGASLASILRLEVNSLPAVSQAVLHAIRPVSTGLVAAAAPATVDGWFPMLAGFWLLGFGMVAALRIRGWRAVRAAVRCSQPFASHHFDHSALDVRSTPGLLEPGVVGIRRPIVLLPGGIDMRLTPSQLRAVLAHERCHIRRRDNLTAAVHMVVEALCWFHPLVWWMGARLLAERERACDEHVLQALDDRRTYAEALVAVCRFYVESPLECVSGVGGPPLASRVERIMQGQIGAQMNTTRKSALIVALLLALFIPVITGAMTMRVPDQSRSGGAGRASVPGTPQEAALKTALFDMRDAIDRFRRDKNRYPRNLAMLVREGYLGAVPLDPFTHSDSTWRIVRDPKNPKTTGVFDVKSASTGVAPDGSKYSDW